MTNNNEILYFKVNTGARTRSEILTLIASLDALIDAMMTQALLSVNDGNVVEYELDTGQSRQKVKYSDSQQVMSAVKKYEQLRTYYQNKINPRQLRAIPGKNMNRRNK